MATPPTYVGHYGVAASKTNAAKTTASFNATAGDVLIAYVYGETAASEAKPGAISNTQGALTWTTKGEYYTGNDSIFAYGKIYSAVVDANKTGMTVSVADNSGNNLGWGMSVIHYTDSDGVGNSNSTGNGTGSGAASISLTHSADNSATVVGVTDWNAVNSARTYLTVNGSSHTERYYSYLPSNVTGLTATHADSGTAGAHTMGLSAPTTYRYAICAVEILGTTSSGLTQDTTDTDNITETVTVAETHNLSVTDNENLTDTPTVAQTHNQSITESHNLTETTTFIQGRSVTDSHNLTDTTSVVQAHASNITDSDNLTDVANVAQAHNQSITESHNLTDAATVGFQYAVNITDNNDLTDSLIVSQTHQASTTDTDNITETVTLVQAHSYTLTENLSLTELVTLSQAHNQAIIEDLALTDSANVVVVPPGTLSVDTTDNLTLTEQIDAALAMAMSSTDNLDLTDSASIVQHHASNFVDLHSLSDLMTFITIVHPIDTLNITDQLTAAILYMNGYVDLLTLTDQATVDLINNGTVDVLDVLGLSDSVIFGGTIQDTSISIVDRVMAWLGNLGYTGSIQDRQYYYLLDQYTTTFGAPVNSLTQGDLQYFLSGHVRELLTEADYV